MNYKVIENKDDIFFKYMPKKKIKKAYIKTKNDKKESPFGVLKNLNFN